MLVDVFTFGFEEDGNVKEPPSQSLSAGIGGSERDDTRKVSLIQESEGRVDVTVGGCSHANDVENVPCTPSFFRGSFYEFAGACLSQVIDESTKPVGLSCR